MSKIPLTKNALCPSLFITQDLRSDICLGQGQDTGVAPASGLLLDICHRVVFAALLLSLKVILAVRIVLIAKLFAASLSQLYCTS